jgi:6-phosphogluconolactonase
MFFTNISVRLGMPGINTFMRIKHNTSELHHLLIGTYTANHSEGLTVCRFDAKNGLLAYLNGMEGVDNPSYLCIAGNGRLIYTVNENSYDQAGGVSALSFDPETDSLKLIDQQTTGRGPCYISVDQALRHAFVANYADGSLSVFPLAKDGALLPAIQQIQHEGCGPDQDRQDKPHLHAAIVAPDDQYVFFTDLGTDQIYSYRYQPFESPPLSPATPSSLAVVPGHGPRHIVFSPDKIFMYLITEMGGMIYVYAYDGPRSTLVQTISLLADGFQGVAGGGDLQISPDGRFLYASNRGDANEIVVFAINAATGKLRFVERTLSRGKSPRNLAIDPSGSFLLVANEVSNDIYVFRIHQQSGKLTLTDSKMNIANPCCLKFIS